MTRGFKYFDIIVAVFAASLLIANLTATKLISFGSIIIDGGAILFPVVYILGDVLTEVYGYKRARRAIWTGFGVMVLAVLCFTIVRELPSAPDYHDQAAYEAVLSSFSLIVVASLAAYLVGSFLNAYVLAKLKLRTKGKKLWLRLISSTFLGQFVDTVVFALIAFGSVLSMGDMVMFILVGWLFKTLVEVLLLPVTYRVVAFLKDKEHADVYDKKTNFSPLDTSL